MPVPTEENPTPEATGPIPEASAAAAPATSGTDEGLMAMDESVVHAEGQTDESATPASPVDAAIQIAQKAQQLFGPREPALNIVQEFETFLPLPGAEFSDKEPVLPLAADTYERTREMLAAAPNVDISKSEAGQEWAFIFNEGQRSVQRADYFQATVQREGSEFHQAVKSEKGLLGAGSPKLAENTGGVKVSGEAAILQVRSLLGLGQVVSVPLWHSGFWVTFKAPSDADFLELHRRLTEEKINLGRQTYGLAFANNSVFFAGAIMDFAMAHVYTTSLKERDMAETRKKISSLDVPLIAWGLACTIWPKGFQYARSIPDLTKGQPREVKERLNLAKLLWVDTKSLTDWQVTHMAQRYGNTMTNDAVEKYRSEFTRGRGREVELRDNLKLTLKVPSMDDYINNGQAWVNSIVAMVDKAFGMGRDNEQRDDYIFSQGKATNFRQYGHWVESVTAGGLEITDSETMNGIFDALSADDEIRDKFFGEVRQFMEDATIALVAVPTFDPEEQKKALPRHPHLLPLDVLSTFFTLLVQRVERVNNRE